MTFSQKNMSFFQLTLTGYVSYQIETEMHEDRSKRKTEKDMMQTGITSRIYSGPESQNDKD